MCTVYFNDQYWLPKKLENLGDSVYNSSTSGVSSINPHSTKESPPPLQTLLDLCK